MFGIELVFGVFLVFIWFNILLVARALTNKATWILGRERTSRELASLIRLFERGEMRKRSQIRRLFVNYTKLQDSISLPPDMRSAILDLARVSNIEKSFVHRLYLPGRIRRMEAAATLGTIASPAARRELERALAKEGDYPVKLYIANTLSDIGDKRSIPALVSSLLGSHRWYRDKVNMLICGFGENLREFLPKYFLREEVEIREFMVDLAGETVSGDLRDWLVDIVDGRESEIARLDSTVKGCSARSCAHCVHGRSILENNRRDCPYNGVMDASDSCRRFRVLPVSIDPGENYRRLAVKAAEALERRHFSVLDHERYLHSADRDIQSVAIMSLSKGGTSEKLDKILGFLGDPETRDVAKRSLVRLLEGHPRLIPQLIDFFSSATGPVRDRAAEVLAGRIEYFINRLDGREREASERIIREIIRLGLVNEIIEFLRGNDNPALEDALVAIIRSVVPGNETLEREFGVYLPDRVLDKCGMTRIVLPVRKREEIRDMGMIRGMYAVLAFALLLFPALYLVRHTHFFGVIPVIQQIKVFIVDFNYNFGWYSIVVSLGYCVLLALSRIKVSRLERLWSLKKKSMLFKPRMLPSISIIAPAFNEEKTIIESVNSLLNLKYPDYELVVVNDGSRDATLATLIRYFGLQRVDFQYRNRLKSHPIRGIYRNPMLGKLIVVDKENGGKADSINAGINIASNEYICGIDADSLLDSDAMLKIASLTLDDGIETPAMGGNVFPINGCRVDRGMITEIGIPKNRLARLQTIEYMRAFMCGRLGWAQLNSLLIISGAFGLFRKERVVSIGGYLTSSEVYRKDTVGEDMELVVRICRYMREHRMKYRIGYAYNANCWTEVPEDLKSLKRQRDRWHRGLIDILFFHRKTLFNPRYGRMGILGMPYYFVFEMVGPLLEVQGYVMVVLAAVGGLMSVKLALFLFMSIVMFGVFISMASIIIAERNFVYFSYRDNMKLLRTALLESFGPRQFFSLWRVVGFFAALKKPEGWGKADRKGFSGTKVPG